MSTQSRDADRPKVFSILLVLIVGSIWWMGEARARIEEARVRAAEYQHPLPIIVRTEASDAHRWLGDDSPMTSRQPWTFAVFSDGEDLSGLREEL
jgi:hypothetical protein